MSWKTGCYIHAGLSRTGPILIEGPEAEKYLQSIVINSFAKFPVGSLKHAVMCTEDGLIAAHGIIERKAENTFESFARGPPGPRVPTEKVTGESLRDVMDVQASLLREGDAYKPLDLPYAPQRWPMAHADHILNKGSLVGYSSGTIYSYHYREVLSMGCVDLDVSDIGTELEVQWGDHGGPIEHIRTTVERFPYLNEDRNSDVNTSTIESGD